MYASFLYAFLAAGSVLAEPELHLRQSNPSVTIPDGTITASTSGNIESFKGIPFAEPPVGELRLRPPQPLNHSFGSITSNSNPTSCPQMFFQDDFPNDLPDSVLGILTNLPIVQSASNAGEDCLTLNVQRPKGTTKDSKLPVAVWIFGGGFELGSTQMYDGSSIIDKSIDMDHPIVYVAMNYRVAGFGFLAGKELAKEGSTNLGLRDQRLALEWVQDNIAAFGGDPEKVTIWGESAGSISVYDQTIINGGNHTYKGKPLFRGGIMNSGTLTPTQTVTSPVAQQVYDNVTRAAGCSGESDTLACLRSLDYEKYLSAANSVAGLLGPRSLDLSYIPRPDPSNDFFPVSPEIALANNNVAPVPVIAGDMEDEGTLFALFTSFLETNDDVITYFTSFFPNETNAQEIVTGLLKTYPDQPYLGQPAGSPFGTGPLNNIYPQYKRWAAVSGDAIFTLTRRGYLSVQSQRVKTWSYLNSYLHDLPILGTAHGTDILLMFGLLDFDKTPAGQTIQSYIVSFVNELDPNAITGGSNNKSDLIAWPQWTNGSRELLHIESTANSLIKDDFREASFEYLNAHSTDLRI